MLFQSGNLQIIMHPFLAQSTQDVRLLALSLIASLFSVITKNLLLAALEIAHLSATLARRVSVTVTDVLYLTRIRLEPYFMLVG